ncbi:MAG: BMP family ABC transporter substrate-binding protein [Spirochaetales bacterium]|nr:BMP family ABC transporter substrate-binding protein [Spirochaetales bacterium]
MQKSLKILLILAAVAVVAVAVVLIVLGRTGAEESPGSFDIGVFVPGVAAGSPLYEQLVSGAEKVASEREMVTVKVIEGGFNQGEWEEKITSIAATGEYEVILSSNPSIPFVALPVAEAFPDQKFIILDAIIESHPQMYTVLYNQVEQAAMLGFLAGLITKSDMPGATPELKLGLIAGQEYDAMLKMILPGFERGAREIDPGISVDFRVLGNWYDANKAADLANSMLDAGVDVILTICGGANQGAITAVKERGRYIVYMDSEDYDLAPGTIVGCSELRQERLVRETLEAAIEGDLDWGSNRIVNSTDDYVAFVDNHELYIKSVPEDIRDTMDSFLKDIRSGRRSYEVPKYW